MWLKIRLKLNLNVLDMNYLILLLFVISGLAIAFFDVRILILDYFSGLNPTLITIEKAIMMIRTIAIMVSLICILVSWLSNSNA